MVLSSPAEGEQLREDIEDITTARDSSVTSVALQRRASSGVATRCIVCMLYMYLVLSAARGAGESERLSYLVAPHRAYLCAMRVQVVFRLAGTGLAKPSETRILVLPVLPCYHIRDNGLVA